MTDERRTRGLRGAHHGDGSERVRVGVTRQPLCFRARETSRRPTHAQRRSRRKETLRSVHSKTFTVMEGAANSATAVTCIWSSSAARNEPLHRIRAGAVDLLRRRSMGMRGRRRSAARRHRDVPYSMLRRRSRYPVVDTRIFEGCHVEHVVAPCGVEEERAFPSSRDVSMPAARSERAAHSRAAALALVRFSSRLP